MSTYIVYIERVTREHASYAITAGSAQEATLEAEARLIDGDDPDDDDVEVRLGEWTITGTRRV